MKGWRGNLPRMCGFGQTWRCCKSKKIIKYSLFQTNTKKISCCKLLRKSLNSSLPSLFYVLIFFSLLLFFLLHLILILPAPALSFLSPTSHLFEKTKYEGYTCSTVDQVCISVAGQIWRGCLHLLIPVIHWRCCCEYVWEGWGWWGSGKQACNHLPFSNYH